MNDGSQEGSNRNMHTPENVEEERKSHEDAPSREMANLSLQGSGNATNASQPGPANREGGELVAAGNDVGNEAPADVNLNVDVGSFQSLDGYNIDDLVQRQQWATASGFAQEPRQLQTVEVLYMIALRQVNFAQINVPQLTQELADRMKKTICSFAGDYCNICDQFGHRASVCPINHMMFVTQRNERDRELANAWDAHKTLMGIDRREQKAEEKRIKAKRLRKQYELSKRGFGHFSREARDPNEDSD